MKTIKRILTGLSIAVAFMFVTSDSPTGIHDFTGNYIGLVLLAVLAVSSAKVRGNIKSLIKSK